MTINSYTSQSRDFEDNTITTLDSLYFNRIVYRFRKDYLADKNVEDNKEEYGTSARSRL